MRARGPGTAIFLRCLRRSVRKDYREHARSSKLMHRVVRCWQAVVMRASVGRRRLLAEVRIERTLALADLRTMLNAQQIDNAQRRRRRCGVLTTCGRLATEVTERSPLSAATCASASWLVAHVFYGWVGMVDYRGDCRVRDASATRAAIQIRVHFRLPQL